MAASTAAPGGPPVRRNRLHRMGIYKCGIRQSLRSVRNINILSLTAFLSMPAALPAVAANLNPPGIANFHQVDDHVYRGAQPTTEGWKTLAGLGVKTIIDLRRDGEMGHSTQAEARAVEAAGMRYVNIPMNGMSAPSQNDVARLLALFNSKDPVFVHCRQGRDRTGTAIACYRIAHDSWSNQKALGEAKSDGIHWFEVAMKHYILNFRPAVQEAGVGLNPKLAAAQP